MSTSGKGTPTFRGMGHPGSVAVPETPLLDGTITPSSSKDAETVSNGSEGRACPHDVLEIIFVQKVGPSSGSNCKDYSPASCRRRSAGLEARVSSATSVT